MFLEKLNIALQNKHTFHCNLLLLFWSTC